MFKKILTGLLISYLGGLITMVFQYINSPNGSIIAGVITIILSFIAMVLILWGLHEISHIHTKFKTARNIVFILFIFTILVLVILPLLVLLFSFYHRIGFINDTYLLLIVYLSFLIIISTYIMYILFLYFLFMGIHELSVKQDYYLLAKHSKKAFIYNIVILISSVVIVNYMYLGVILLINRPGLALLFLLLSIAAIISIIVIIIKTLIFEVYALYNASLLLA